MKFFLLAFFFVFVFFSCNNEIQELLPGVTGKAGEVLVVVDQTNWRGELGDSIRAVLQQEFPAVPQPEACFDPISIPNSAFSKLFRSHRNIIFINFSSDFKEPKMIVKKDVHAESQFIMDINVSDKKSCIDFIMRRRDAIIDLLTNAERDRIISNYRKYPERSIIDVLKTRHNVNLTIPSGYILSVDSADFVWISLETPMISQGILIYSYNYTDTNTFTLDYLVEKRDRFLKKYVPGALPNTYMITAKNFPVEFSEFEHEGKYTAGLRGLWEVQNDFMGGPFISFSKVDEKKNKVVTVEGFVYAPKYDKRNYLRQVEAILYTFKIVE
ncbi:MAG: DUF4837 family protein [Bacteroidota bacterium]